MAHKVFAPYEVIAGGYDIEEYCPHCDKSIPVILDDGQADLETVCPSCGKRLMLCTVCDTECDWEFGCGCCMDKAHITTHTTDLPQTR